MQSLKGEACGVSVELRGGGCVEEGRRKVGATRIQSLTKEGRISPQ